MKKIVKVSVLFLLFSLILSPSLFAEEEVLWGSYHSPGNVEFGFAGAYEIGRDSLSSKSLGLYPSMEVLLWKPGVSGYAPLDFGLAAEGRIGLPLSKGGGLTAGVAAEGTIHIGFRGFDFPGAEYLDKFEIYARMGVSFDIIHPQGNLPFGLVATSGANYFIDDRLMVGLSYTGWGSGENGVDGVSLQVRYRMGKTPTVKGMGDAWKRYEETMVAMESMGPVTQFYSFFYYSVYSGGYYWNGETFPEGMGTVWKYENNDNDSFTIERTLIELTEEGEWWGLKYLQEEDNDYIEYEFLLSPEKELIILYYRDDNGQVRSYDFDDDNELTYLSEESVVNYADMESMSSGKEDVTVPAGTFKNCSVIEESADGVEYKWYFTDKENIPGRMVKFTSQDGKDFFSGQLVEVVTDRKGDFRLK
jgi:hypothetical protein